MNTDLERKAAAALSGDVTSAVLAELIIDVEDAIKQAEATAKAERDKALDPVAAPDPKAACAAAEDATIAAGRLRTLHPRLEARFSEMQAKERLAKWHADYATLKPKRDALATELRELYPAAVAKLVDLFARSADLDAEIGKLHQARPSGVSLHLRTAELEARGLESFRRDRPSIAHELKLPDWENSDRMAWPARQLGGGIAASYAEIAPPGAYDRRYSADWWRDADARQAAQQEEAKRVSDYYEGKERERKQREELERGSRR